MFSLAFLLMALERIVRELPHVQRTEYHPYTYVVRLITFAIILVAIADKNRNER